MPIKSPFESFDIKKAKDALVKLAADPEAEESLAFFNGDHWQETEGWVGPAPSTRDAASNLIMEQIEEAFVSENAIAEVVNRHADALLARADSSWYLQPQDLSTAIPGAKRPNILSQAVDKAKKATAKVLKRPNPTKPELPEPARDPNDPNQSQAKSPLGIEDPLVAEIMPFLLKWWVKRDVLGELRKVTENLLVTKRGGMRLFVPYGLLDGGNMPPGTFEECLDRIYVESTDNASAAMLVDRSTMQELYIHVWKEKSVEDDKEYENVERAYVDIDTGLTLIDFESEDPAQQPATIEVDLKRRNLYFEVKRNHAMITPQVKQLQKLLNMALTMMGRNVVQAGFLERVITNAQIPGNEVVDGSVAGGKRFVPDPIQIGPSHITNLMGVVTEDDEGRRTLANPTINYRDPVDVKTFVETRHTAYMGILQDCDQTHMLIAGDAFASGDARIQARASFITSVIKTKNTVEPLVVWLIETVIQMAATFSGSADKYVSLRAIVDLKPDTGPLTPQERTVIIEQYTKGLMSREVAMVMLGTNNVEEEIEKIEAEKRVTTPTELAGIFTALAKTGWQLSMEQLPEVDENILGLTPRNVEAYKKELDEKAERDSKTSAINGQFGGSPLQGRNKPGSDDPGPSGGGGDE